jgi:hypothetical protein
MANGRRSSRGGPSGEIHPLFAELYLSGDDGDETDEKRRTARKRARARQVLPARQVTRRA